MKRVVLRPLLPLALFAGVLLMLGLAGSSARADILQSDTNLVTLPENAQETVAADVQSATAEITFDKVKGAPSYTRINVIGSPTGMTADGSMIVGNSPALRGYWTWSEAEGYREIGGFGAFGGSPGISDDGSKVAGTFEVAGHVVKWAIWDHATRTWTPLPNPTPGSTCPRDTPFGEKLVEGSVWGISGDGSTIVGSTYNDGPNSCDKPLGTAWYAASGSVLLEKYPGSATIPQSRANKASYDGSILVGYDTGNGGRNGVYWENGVEHFLGSPSQDPFVNEASDVTRDGLTIVGGQYAPHDGAWKYNRITGEREIIALSTRFTTPIAYRVNDAADVIGGFVTKGSALIPMIWTRQLGFVNMNQFLEAQGIHLRGGLIWGNITAISADGTVWAAYQVNPSGLFFPALVHISKAIVCHKPQGKAKSIAVAFPGSFDDHLAHGDTAGYCQ